MKLIRHNGLSYYRFDLFEPYPQLVHGVFTRTGGVSPPPCQGLNLAFVPEDEEENVRRNLEMAAASLGFDSLVFAGQVHGDQALVVRRDDGYRPRTAGEVLRGYDALITPDAEAALLIKLADCQGVILFDPVTGVTAVVHSGWRGSVANIIGKTVARLTREFGVNPVGLLAAISPSLGPCCAEFVNYRRELPEDFWAYRTDEHHFDFWAISRRQLTDAGVLPQHIETAGICTVCGSTDFYSYRRDKVTGRFGVVAGLRKEH